MYRRLDWALWCINSEVFWVNAALAGMRTGSAGPNARAESFMATLKPILLRITPIFWPGTRRVEFRTISRENSVRLPCGEQNTLGRV